jgi:tetratricopeptide (TPR) repeat protein
MTFVNKLYFYFFFVSLMIILFSLYSFSQDRLRYQLQNQLNYAKDLYNKEEYFDAITELKRLLFFDKENEYSYSVNELIGLSYKMGGKFSEAIQYFTLAKIKASNNEQLYNSEIEIVRINILRRTIDRALTLLDSLDSNIKFINKKNDINYWRGWAYIFDSNWEKAAYEFNKISSNHELKILLEKVENEKYSVTKAKILSFIFPGAGQFYTGNYISGILSFGWNLLWGYVTVNSIVKNRVFDGIVAGDLLWLRFYRGNIQNAEKFAEEKNVEIGNKALKFLQFEYKGEKP